MVIAQRSDLGSDLRDDMRDNMRDDMHSVTCIPCNSSFRGPTKQVARPL